MERVKERLIKVDGTLYQLHVFVNEVYTQIRYVLLDRQGRELDRRTISAAKGECFNIAEWASRIHHAKPTIERHLNSIDAWDWEIESSYFMQ
ncbi:regulator of G-protein signaling domain-containing protein [Listeria kieliensis]